MNKGFTLPELIVVIGVFSVLIGLAITNIVRFQNKASLQTTVSMVTRDIQNQQLKTMVGDSEGRATSDGYGIFFEINNYILFHGSSYQSGNPSNYNVPLEESLQFNDITFPENQIVFASGSGEVDNFIDGSNSVDIVNRLNGEQKTVTINGLGVIIGIN